MKKKNIIVIIIILIIVPIAWYVGAPLVTNTLVEEDFPTAVSSSASSQSSLGKVINTQELAMLEQLTAEQVDAMPAKQQEVLQKNMQDFADQMPSKIVQEEMPMVTVEPVLLAEGYFSGADSFHKGSGKAALYTLPDNSTVLRFTDFSVTNGPALSVFLMNASGQKIEIAKLKGNQGNQNYPVANTINTTEFNQVLIYCVPFKVQFATARLQ